MSKHAYLGTDASLRPENSSFAALAVSAIPVAVVGAGGIGSAATYWLSRRSVADVVCLEQWALGHDRGASEDHSRIIRLGYHASGTPRSPAPPTRRGRWSSAEAGVPLVHRTGMVNLARRGSEGTGILRQLRAGDGRARHRLRATRRR